MGQSPLRMAPRSSSAYLQPTSGGALYRYPFIERSASYVVWPPLRDLLLCAKHLFVAAMVASGGHKTERYARQVW